MRRREELAAGLRTVRERIEKACSATGRDPSEITLVAVTKYFPASDIDLLTELGVRAIGENRDQEASAKLRDVAHRSEIEVHFVGQLQSRKAGHVAAYADVVQSVDRPKLVDALARATERHGRHLGVGGEGKLVDCPAGRGGGRPAPPPPLAEAVVAAAGLDLRGVMAVAPLGADPAPAFARLREVADGIRASHPEARWISAGMSEDLEAAIAAGATHLRVGSAILGSRPPLR